MSELLVEHVTVTYPRRGGGVTALQDVSIEVKHGQFVSIVGASGCGKSTLLNVVGGLVAPTSGQVLLDGEPIRGPGADRGMVFQSYTLYPWLTVRKNVEFGLKLRHVPRAERRRVSDELLAQMRLQGFEDAYPKALSGGMKQRVAIARALANQPSVLLMDEPFGALDAQTRTVMQELLLDVWERLRTTILFVTHDIDEALFLGDRVFVMTARPGRFREEVSLTLPRPRTLEITTSEEFVSAKRRVLAMIREETARTMSASVGAGDGLQV
jgi:ABC-type nitrate/sulfonate/bicarbonate transport system ATPase subunit